MILDQFLKTNRVWDSALQPQAYIEIGILQKWNIPLAHTRFFWTSTNLRPKIGGLRPGSAQNVSR